MGHENMLTYDEALTRVLTQVPQPRMVQLALEASLGRVLASRIHADLDLPPFRKSFMDGYAVRSQDVSAAPVRLQVIGRVGAGSTAQPQVEANQAVQVMTGATVPPGADAVQRVEKTRSLSSTVVEILEPVEAGENVAAQASEVKRGQVVLERGTLIDPAQIGVLATFGQKEVCVYAPPTVAVISTGDEIVDIEAKPGLGQIRNSNSPMLWAQCRRLGLEVETLPVVPDEPKKVREALARGLRQDLVVFSGGVSMGEYDYVHKILAEEEVQILFHKAAIKPGKPILVGRTDRGMIFALPGNPVSCFVTFELFVRPAARKWMGFEDRYLSKVPAKLLKDVVQKPGRMFFKPALTRFSSEGFKVEPIRTKGSADLVAFARANSLLIVGKDVTRLQAGQSVDVLLLSALDQGWLESEGSIREADASG